MIFPSKIKEFIKDKNYSQDDVGMSNSQVLIFDDMVLKIEKRTEWKESFDFYKTQNVVNMMNWSQDFVIVPKVLCFEQTDEFDYEFGDDLMVYIPKNKTEKFTKQHIYYSTPAKFIDYYHGNVLCEVEELGTILLPIYYTRLV